MSKESGVKFKSRKSRHVISLDEEPERATFTLPGLRQRSRSRDRLEQTRQLKRGEQGKSIEELEKLEKAGFVMTGTRSARINMIREHQARDAEADSLTNRLQEKGKREDALIDHFRSLLQQDKSSTISRP